MSLFWVRDEATGRSMTVRVPPEVKGLPAQEVFAWLRAEVARRASTQGTDDLHSPTPGRAEAETGAVAAPGQSVCTA